LAPREECLLHRREIDDGIAREAGERRRAEHAEPVVDVGIAGVDDFGTAATLAGRDSRHG